MTFWLFMYEVKVMARYKLGDIDNERFYMIPKSFFVCDEYRDMGLTAKVLYGVLHDRMELSRCNGWVDEDGAIFMIYTVDNLVSVLGVDRKTIFKAMNELKEKELLEAKRQGQGQPNKLYLHKMKPVDVSEVPKKDSRSTEKGTREVPKSGTSRSGENGTLMILSNSDTENSDTEKGIRNTEGVATAHPNVPYQKVVEQYHQVCISLPRVKVISEPRKRAIKARWNEWGKNIDTFAECFRKVEASDFLTGRSKDWMAGFDWIMSPSNFTKIMEGNYDNKEHKQSSPSQPSNGIVDTDIDWSKYDG